MVAGGCFASGLSLFWCGYRPTASRIFLISSNVWTAVVGVLGNLTGMQSRWYAISRRVHTVKFDLNGGAAKIVCLILRCPTRTCFLAQFYTASPLHAMYVHQYKFYFSPPPLLAGETSTATVSLLAVEGYSVQAPHKGTSGDRQADWRWAYRISCLPTLDRVAPIISSQFYDDDSYSLPTQRLPSDGPHAAIYIYNFYRANVLQEGDPDSTP